MGPGDPLLVSPIDPSKAKIGRVDEGVDITQSSPFNAIAAGVISYIDPNFYQGTPAVYETLDRPIVVNGHVYKEVYYSETASLVRLGQHISAGQPVISGGSAELGFASGNLPAAHSIYHEGNETPQGDDFASILAKAIYVGSPDQTPGTSVTRVNPQTGETVTTKGPKVPWFLDLSSISGVLGSIFSWFTDHLLRLGLLLAGGALIIIGVLLVARSAGAGV